MSLVEVRHPVDVSRSLSGNQQPLQILRVPRWLTTCFIAHGSTPNGILIKLRQYDGNLLTQNNLYYSWALLFRSLRSGILETFPPPFV